MLSRISIAPILMLLASPAIPAQPQAPPAAKPADVQRAVEKEQAVRQTVERSLPFIQRQGVDWMNEKKCATCHHSTFMVWSLNAAADRGFAVDAAKLMEWNTWARDFRSIRGRDRNDAKEEEAYKTFRGSPEEMSQLLLGRRRAGLSPKQQAAEAEWSTLMRTHLLSGQPEEDSWKPGGQLPSQKRPLRETQEVTALWALVAVQATDSRDESARTAEDRAVAWLKNDTVGESTEWWAVKMLWERGRGKPESANSCREKLLKSQREDGGWGWLLAEESDALGTGLALYALVRDGLAPDHAAVQRARDFLCKTQTTDGSWPVRGTKKNARNRIEPTATFWGTCWAVIGLLETLPLAERQSRP